LFFVLSSLYLSQRFCFSFSCHFSHTRLFVFRSPVTSSLTEILFFIFL
jgi:hypothetical protein